MQNKKEKIFILIQCIIVMILLFLQFQAIRKCQVITYELFLLGIGPFLIFIGICEKIRCVFIKSEKEKGYKIIFILGVLLTCFAYTYWYVKTESYQDPYVDTGVAVYWQIRDENSTVDEYCFEYGGDKYVEIYCESEYNRTIARECKKEMDKYTKSNQPLFNIREEPGLFSMLYTPQMQNMYKMENDRGYLVFTNGHEMYCKESEFDEVDSYYKDKFLK